MLKINLESVKAQVKKRIVLIIIGILVGIAALSEVSDVDTHLSLSSRLRMKKMRSLKLVSLSKEPNTVTSTQYLRYTYP